MKAHEEYAARAVMQLRSAKTDDDARASLALVFEMAIARETLRCIRTAEYECDKIEREERSKMTQACAENRPEAEIVFGHGAWVANTLGLSVGKAIDECGYEDPIADAIERCAAICDAHAAELQATADKYPAGTAACFAAEAMALAKMIRGER